ncbi:MAG: hypothetical protein IT287_01845 [Bdellovibrionaceae bacterium]|nr:hypothetical protein [Pseudobdellovibrionaceae bacterium]
MTPIPTTDLYSYLPHKPPMVWVDTVLSFDSSGGNTDVTLKEGGHYFTDGVLRPSSFIEFIAQSYAFTNLAFRRNSGETHAVHTKTYLAAIKDFHFEKKMNLQPGEKIFIKVKKARVFGPITIVKGECHHNEILVATCELKVFNE